MALSRRDFIVSSAVASVTAGVALTSPLPAQGGEKPTATTGQSVEIVPEFEISMKGARDPLARLDRADFASQVNTRFGVRSEAGLVVDLELVSVEDLGSPVRSNRRGPMKPETFVLRFTGPSEVQLESTTYSFEHGVLGAFDLMISPGGRTATGLVYSAVINRI